MDADAIRLPGAQRVAASGLLDLQHFRAKIRELEADHIAGNQARHVDHSHAVERAGRFRFERFLRHAHRSTPIAQASEPLTLPAQAGDARSWRRKDSRYGTITRRLIRECRT